MTKIQRIGVGIGVLCFCLLVSSIAFMGWLSAQSAPSIAQGFQTSDANMVAGALVSLKKSSPNTVELSNPERRPYLLGVVGDKPFLELSDGQSQVQIVTSGVTLALISDLAGDIKIGDRITASPIAGVGMKAVENGVVVGVAQADLGDVKIARKNITDKHGATKSVRIGLVPIQVNVATYSVREGESDYLPSILQNLANGVAGKEVTPMRVVIATVLMLLLFVSVTVLLRTTVRSSITALGRNPLSEASLRKSLGQIGLTVMGIVVLGFVCIYLILKV